jgi:hypothetical protein
VNSSASSAPSAVKNYLDNRFFGSDPQTPCIGATDSEKQPCGGIT